MGATDDPHEALFLMFQAMYAADSGSGGLSNSTGNQYVRSFLRSWEQQAAGSPPVPRILCEVVDDTDQSPFGGDSPSCRVRLHVFTPKDPGNAFEKAILTRMRTVYKETAPAGAQGGFTGNRFRWWRTIRAPVADSNMNHRVVEFTIKMTA